jgi:hypothetical protein
MQDRADAQNDEILGKSTEKRSVSKRRGSNNDGYYDAADGDSIGSSHQPDRRGRPDKRPNVEASASVAGVLEHYRDRSRDRIGERSKSRIRTGAEITASGLAGDVLGHFLENRNAKATFRASQDYDDEESDLEAVAGLEAMRMADVQELRDCISTNVGMQSPNLDLIGDTIAERVRETGAKVCLTNVSANAPPLTIFAAQIQTT